MYECFLNIAITSDHIRLCLSKEVDSYDRNFLFHRMKRLQMVFLLKFKITLDNKPYH